MLDWCTLAELWTHARCQTGHIRLDTSATTTKREAFAPGLRGRASGGERDLHSRALTQLLYGGSRRFPSCL